MNEMQIQSRLDVGKLFLGNMKLLAESKFSQIIIELKFIEKKEKVKLKLKPIKRIWLLQITYIQIRLNLRADSALLFFIALMFSSIKIKEI